MVVFRRFGMDELRSSRDISAQQTGALARRKGALRCQAQAKLQNRLNSKGIMWSFDFDTYKYLLIRHPCGTVCFFLSLFYQRAMETHKFPRHQTPTAEVNEGQLQVLRMPAIRGRNPSLLLPLIQLFSLHILEQADVSFKFYASHIRFRSISESTSSSPSVFHVYTPLFYFQDES